MKSQRIIPAIAVILMSFLLRCSPLPATSPTGTGVSINPPSQLIPPTSSSITASTVLPEPSLTSDESEKTVEDFLKNNRECSLPCVWGIKPGQSQFIDVEHFFESLNWQGNTLNEIYYAGKDLQKPALSIRAGIYPSGGTVEKFHIAIGGNDFITKIGYFAFRNVLEVLGKPSDILIFIGTDPDVLEPVETSFEILLYYHDENILFEYAGTAVKVMDGYRVCPSDPEAESTQIDSTAGYVSIYTGLDNEETTVQELVRPFWILPKYYLSIEQALGINIDQFYEKVTRTTGNVCFDSPLASWQR